VKVADIPAEALPRAMQKMDADEREKYVEEKAKERADLKAQIAKLAQERDAYVRRELQKRAADSTRTVDEALIESAKALAETANYSF